jgi:hypothetical protein
MSNNSDVTIGGLRFVMTSLAAPEQYEVFDFKGAQVGFARLHHGSFRVSVPDFLDHTVLLAKPYGADGVFVDEQQRIEYLRSAATAISASQAEDVRYPI